LRERRTLLAARRASVQRERHDREAAAQQGVQLARVATQLEQFRSVSAAGLDSASFAHRRAMVDLLIDRVVMDAPEVEIRDIIPLTGLAQRKGVLPFRHRAAQRGAASPRASHSHLPHPRPGRPPAGGVAHGAR
jgi:hypothetical protein